MARSWPANLTMACKTCTWRAPRGTALPGLHPDEAVVRSRGELGGRGTTCAPHALTTTPTADASAAGRGRTGSGRPVLAGLLLGERLEPPFDLCDPALQLLDLAGRRLELLDDRVGQALELPLERLQQAHPPALHILHRPLRPPLHICTQLPNVDQRENLVHHRLAAAFDQPARVVA